MSGGTFRVMNVRHLTDYTYVLRVERGGMPGIAGQCCTVGPAGSDVNREYSLYSGSDDPYFDFLIREVEGGRVSGALKNCKAGDEVDVDGPYGSFVIHEPHDSSQQYLFVASGVGIAPFHGFVRTYPWLDYRLVHGVRRLEERYDMEAYESSRYLSCVTGEAGGDYRGRVTDYLRQNPVDPRTCCYICGNSNMVWEVFDILRDQGVDGDHLFTEAFF